MSDIVLATLNARYSHASLGLRYLLANLGDLAPRAELQEFTIKDATDGMVEKLLAAEPKIIGLGIYIWNVTATTALVKALKALRPDVCIVLGGPEVSHETQGQDIVEAADYVICGEGEADFPVLCRAVLGGSPPADKIRAAPLPDPMALVLPYALYSDKDVSTRVVYVEASRGCPYKCEFCLSSLDKSVRDIPLESFLAQMDVLLGRGVTQLKFIDRTFNLKLETSRRILQFFLDRMRPGLFLHFELVPDRLPEGLRELVVQFPQGTLQFEVGIQTFNDEVCRHISRRQDVGRLEDNLRFLRAHTKVHVHADLIVGLPGESLESFALGFDRLYALQPQEIQVGMLKRLRGTPIVRHTPAFAMVYDPLPPYEIQSNSVLDDATVRRLKQLGKFWDLFANSGNFRESLKLVLALDPSPFAAFLKFSDWLFARTQRLHSLPLDERVAQLMTYLDEQGVSRDVSGPVLVADYVRQHERQVPECLRPYKVRRVARGQKALAPSRQARHLG